MGTPESKPLVAEPAAGTAIFTIGVDGRLYCHDVTPELLQVLVEICPENPSLHARIETLGMTNEGLK